MPSPELAALLAAIARQPYDPTRSVEALRTDTEAAAERQNAAIPADTMLMAVDCGGVPGEWTAAAGTADSPRVVLYLHGGGYYRGSSRSSRRLAWLLSRATGCRVLAVDYRLAPEHPFPAALDDARTAWQWLRSQGVPPQQAVLAGSSAGGGLLLALLLALRRASEPLPGAAVALSPWADLENDSPAMHTLGEDDPRFPKAYQDRMAACYLRDHDPRDPLASPVHADFTGFPPLLIQVGSNERLLDDAQRVTARARAAGVTAVLETYDQAPHGWHQGAPEVPEARRALEAIARFLQAHPGNPHDDAW